MPDVKPKEKISVSKLNKFVTKWKNKLLGRDTPSSPVAEKGSGAQNVSRGDSARSREPAVVVQHPERGKGQVGQQQAADPKFIATVRRQRDVVVAPAPAAPEAYMRAHDPSATNLEAWYSCSTYGPPSREPQTPLAIAHQSALYAPGAMPIQQPLGSSSPHTSMHQPHMQQHAGLYGAPPASPLRSSGPLVLPGQREHSTFPPPPDMYGSGYGGSASVQPHTPQYPHSAHAGRAGSMPPQQLASGTAGPYSSTCGLGVGGVGHAASLPSAVHDTVLAPPPVGRGDGAVLAASASAAGTLAQQALHVLLSELEVELSEVTSTQRTLAARSQLLGNLLTMLPADQSQGQRALDGMVQRLMRETARVGADLRDAEQRLQVLFFARGEWESTLRMIEGICDNAALEQHVGQLQTVLFKEATTRIQAFQHQMQRQAVQQGGSSTGGASAADGATPVKNQALVRQDSSLSSHGSSMHTASTSVGAGRGRPPSSRMAAPSPASLPTPPNQDVRRAAAEYSEQRPASGYSTPPAAAPPPYQTSGATSEPPQASHTGQGVPGGTQPAARAQWLAPTSAAKRQELARVALVQQHAQRSRGESPAGPSHTGVPSTSYSPSPDSGSPIAPRHEPHPATTPFAAAPRMPLHPQHLAILQQAAGYGPQGHDEGCETAASLVSFGRSSLSQRGPAPGRGKARRSLSRGEERLYLSAINALHSEHRRRTGDMTPHVTQAGITRATIYEDARSEAGGPTIDPVSATAGDEEEEEDEDEEGSTDDDEEEEEEDEGSYGYFELNHKAGNTNSSASNLASQSNSQVQQQQQQQHASGASATPGGFDMRRLQSRLSSLQPQ